MKANGSVQSLTKAFASFSKVSERNFMRLDSKLDDLLTYANKLEKDIFELSDQLSELKVDIEKLKSRVGVIENKITLIENDIYEIRMNQAGHSDEIEKLSSSTKGLTRDISEIYDRIVKLEHKTT